MAPERRTGDNSRLVQLLLITKTKIIIFKKCCRVALSLMYEPDKDHKLLKVYYTKLMAIVVVRRSEMFLSIVIYWWKFGAGGR